MQLFDLLAVGAVVLAALVFLIRLWLGNVRQGQTCGCSGCDGCSGAAEKKETCPGESESSGGAPLGDLRKK